jgi:hypothetical protein
MRRKRPYGVIPVRKIFHIVTEGEVTEKVYFRHIGRFRKNININVHTKKHGLNAKIIMDLLQIKVIDKKTLNDGDEVWIVIDRDRWDMKHVEQCYKKICKLNKSNDEGENKEVSFEMAFSNPCFEYWLLLHFEKPKNITAKNITNKLKKHIPNYEKLKNVNNCKYFTENCINKAIENAKKDRDIMKCKWPESTGTTVYRLVEDIFG